jgi:hypothetical protein
MRTRRIVESPRGFGTVTRDNEIIGRAEYQLAVWQEYDDGLKGLLDISGTVQGDDLDIFALLQDGAELTLTTADGRTLPYFYTDLTGTIAARGDFK